MRTTDKGIAFLERLEGVVLRAYRCPAGQWTIGGGLTKASGVVVPKAGMVITAVEASTLLARALARNYEPRVATAMPGAQPHEFDGGVSFHFNTGAIGRASWVKSWQARDWAGVRNNLAKWRKGGGRVLPGLVRRRAEEAKLILFGDYGRRRSGPRVPGDARLALPVTKTEVPALRTALAKLGFDPGPRTDAIAERAVRDFQRGHGLTVDGVLGRATAATIQRRLDASAKAKGAGAASAGGAGVATGAETGALPDAAGLGALGWLMLAAGALWLIWLAWQYRDAIAAKVQPRLPRLAARLRSF